MIPPAMLRLKIRDAQNKGFGLWLPILLLWPLFILFGILLLPLVLLVSAFKFGPFKGPKAVALFYELFCSLRGLQVNVQGADGSSVKIIIW